MRYLVTAMFILTLPVISVANGVAWHEVKQPSKDAAAVYGSYSAGCVAGAVPLEAHAEGLMTVRRGRHRYFGHPSLVEMLRKFGRDVARRRSELLLISDLSQPRGGYPPPGSEHKSHQNGLDVDIWYKRLEIFPGIESLDPTDLHAPKVVAQDGASVNRQYWQHSNADIVLMAASYDEVARIFTHPAVKKEICNIYSKDEPKRRLLRKIRPWWGHDRHFHVRLKCPKGEDGCKDQAPPPRGSGCDASLEWWFSDEAKELASQPKKPYIPPELPAECAALRGATDSHP